MPLPISAIPATPREGELANSARESAETLALLARRRSTKIAHLAEPGPSGVEIDALIALAARVPDHGKLGAMALCDPRRRSAGARRRRRS